ncbi:MAG: DUF6531 domain-containing protein [Bdellovibrionaceae bacterium]|nr:DUF6531 domain-containing protein [Pseudobdellovibrionaceae bacterium]MDW8189985.1 DUF6531 domain-containing protein [Pseudobdellovibrionaceae bacterium]
MRAKFIFIIIFVIFSIFSIRTFAIVDMKNANYSNTWIDMDVGGSGYDLKVLRTYNSRSLYEGIFGFGWCSNFETQAVIGQSDLIKIIECGAGQETPFQLENGKHRKEGASYRSRFNHNDILTVTKENLVRQLPDGSSMKFDLAGKLLNIYDKNGNYLKFEYQENKLKFVVDNLGRRLSFSYYPSTGKVRSIVGPNNQKVEYEYKNLVDLSKVKNAWGNTYLFEYNNFHNLIKVTYPDKSTIKLDYDDQNDWVTAFHDREGCTEYYKYDFPQKDRELHYWANVVKKCKNQVVSEAKHEFWFRRRQGSGELFLSRVMSTVNNQTIDIEYHEVFNRPVVIKRNGDVQKFEYNKLGQIIKKTSMGIELVYEYHKDHNKVAKVETRYLDSSGKVRMSKVTHFYYDKKLNLVRAEESDGRVVFLDHDEKGRIISVRDHTKKEVRIEYDERFSKPKILERPKVGRVVVHYKPNGEIDHFGKDQDVTVISQIVSTFNNLMDIIAPATAEIYN